MNFNQRLTLSFITLVIISTLICSVEYLTLEDVGNIIGVFTPFILLIWFYYSQKRILSKSYFDQIDGIYAGYTTPTVKIEGKFIKAGLIFNIRDTDDSGYFKGELDYAELEHGTTNQEYHSNKVIEAIYTLFGKMEFKIYNDKIRHPFKPEENRVYKGTLTIVDRLDFQFEDYKIENYVSAEYLIEHYREMQTMKFTLIKKHRPDFVHLPDTFTLYKSMGFEFEPYTSVKSDIFQGNTFSDRRSVS